MKDTRIVIEKSTVNDAQEIINVINSSNRKAFGQIIPREYFREPIITLKEFEERIEKMTFYVYKEGDVIVGVAALSIENEHDGRIRWVYVLPEYQKKGIGSALITHIERLAEEMGLNRIRLVTDSDAKWAIRFYRKLGYAQTDKVPNPWGFDQWMEKQL